LSERKRCEKTKDMGRAHLKLTVQPAQQAELEKHFKAAADVRQRQRLQAILLARTGQHGYRDIAQIVGCATSTFALWLNKYLAGGVEELLRRDTPPGSSSPIAAVAVQRELVAGLKAGRWRTAGQVAAWLKQAHGIKRATKSVYRWLGKVGGALRVPRPAHTLQNPPAAAVFRAELEQRLEKLALPKDKPVKIWVADESRFGLHTQSRRCWTLRGQRVVIGQQQRYEWEYVYGALEVLGGDAQFRFMPSVGLGLSLDFLRQIADSDPVAEHVVIWDQAGFHPRPGALDLPRRIHLLPLPPYSPELNPVEGLWDQVQDVTCNRAPASLEALEETLTSALRPFWEVPDKVLSLIHHWLRLQANITL
jgi:putative transposase